MWQEMLPWSQQNISYMCKEDLQGEPQGSLCGSHSRGRVEHLEKRKGKSKIQKNSIKGSQNAFQNIMCGKN